MKDELKELKECNAKFEEMENVEELGSARDYLTGVGIGVGIVAGIVALT